MLFFVEMWERFSYYGMRGLLVLYLTAAIAVHQLAPGTYTNTLQIEQQLAATEDEENAKVELPVFVQRVPLVVSVDGKAVAGPVEGAPGPLQIQRLAKRPDPNHPGRYLWAPDGGAGLSGAVFDVKAGLRPDGDEIRYRITNPLDRKVNLKIKLLRPYPEQKQAELAAAAGERARAQGQTPEKVKAAEEAARRADDPEYKVYFKFNDNTSVQSTKITPEARRDPDDEPFELTLDINRIDSGRSWVKAEANTLYGWYTGMAYLLPIIGGLIADKLIGTHRSMVVGGVLIALGHMILWASGIGTMSHSSTGMSVFVAGLALITIGTGHFKPSVSVMVGQLYPHGDPRRESAFSIFYMGINLGSFLSNLACGTLAVTLGWHWGFGAATIGMIAGLVMYVIGRPAYLGLIGESDSPFRNKVWVFLPIGLTLAALIGWLFHIGVLRQVDAVASRPIVAGAIALLAIGYALWMILKQLPGDRGPVATIFIYMLFNAVFWLSFEQAGASLNTFTDELTNRHFLGMDWKVPTTWFQSLNPLLIIIFAPIFGVFWASLLRRNRSVPQPVKIGVGLIFVGLGYIVMVLAAMKLNTGVAKVSMIYIAGCYFLHTVGEIILSPTGLSYVAKTAPRSQMSSLMGIWFISSFVAGLSAGKVGALVDPIIDGKVKLPWSRWFGGQADFFVLFVITSVAAGVLMIACSPLLTRLQRNPKD
ncbi:MAG: oligopeptide:H+ symporter [Phycisphaerales bacterium]|nr:oligopeptide:H+ symporter [Phycisphaerales bacterium]